MDVCDCSFDYCRCRSRVAIVRQFDWAQVTEQASIGWDCATPSTPSGPLASCSASSASGVIKACRYSFVRVVPIRNHVSAMCSSILRWSSFEMRRASSRHSWALARQSSKGRPSVLGASDMLLPPGRPVLKTDRPRRAQQARLHSSSSAPATCPVNGLTRCPCLQARHSVLT
jgi:hypothetical protein